MKIIIENQFLLFCLGSLGILLLFQILNLIYKTFLRKQHNLQKRYGKNTYALVTGATDGIGYEFCNQLSKIGFKILMVGRNELKLKTAREQLLLKNKNCEFHIIVQDLSKSFEKEFVQQFQTKILPFDISLLVNCAGITTFNKFEEENPALIQSMTFIDSLAPVLISQTIIKDKFLRRNQILKSGIINVSTSAFIVPMGYYTSYGAAKAYLDFFSQSLQTEYSNIDILSIRPFDVSTRQTNFRKQDFFTLTPSECVIGCLNDLGYENITYGHWRHKINAALVEYCPRKLFNYMYFNILVPQFFNEHKQREKLLEQEESQYLLQQS